MELPGPLALASDRVLKYTRPGEDLDVMIIHVQDENPLLVAGKGHRTGEITPAVSLLFRTDLPCHISQRLGLAADSGLIMTAQPDGQHNWQSRFFHVLKP